MRNPIVRLAAVCASLLAFTPSAWAQNNGHLDNQWFTAQVKAVVTTSTYDGTFNYATMEEKVKYDIGKERCYVALWWHGADRFTYSAVPLCQDASGEWLVFNRCRLYELEDGPIIGRDCVLPFVATGDRAAGPGLRALAVGALLRFDPKLGKDGEARSVKYLGSKRVTVYRYDWTSQGGINSEGLWGAGEGKFRLTYIDESKVPDGAKSAFQNWIAGN